MGCACGRRVGGGGGDPVGVLVRVSGVVVIDLWSGVRFGEVACVVF